MKKIILTLLIFFAGINCLANPIDDLQGKWKLTSNGKNSVNLALTFSNDTVIIDDEFEGSIYTYKINNDIIEVCNLKNSPFGYSRAGFYIKLLSDIGDDNLTVAYIDRKTGKGINETFTYIKSND